MTIGMDRRARAIGELFRDGMACNGKTVDISVGTHNCPRCARKPNGQETSTIPIAHVPCRHHCTVAFDTTAARADNARR